MLKETVTVVMRSKKIFQGPMVRDSSDQPTNAYLYLPRRLSALDSIANSSVDVPIRSKCHDEGTLRTSCTRSSIVQSLYHSEAPKT
jgi:hypothetical protein